MITYKNLRDVKVVYGKTLFDIYNTTAITIDVYESDRILGWFETKDKFIKTVNLIRVQDIYQVWRDLDDIHSPIVDTTQLEYLLSEYKSSIAKWEREVRIIEAINNYKDNRCLK